MLSRTRTTKLPVVVSPSASVALALTVVSPMGNQLPLAWLSTTVGTVASPMSATPALKVTVAPAGPVASATTIEVGSDSTGAVFTFPVPEIGKSKVPALGALVTR